MKNVCFEKSIWATKVCARKRMQTCKLHSCIWRVLINPKLRFSLFCLFFVNKPETPIFVILFVLCSLRQPFRFLIYFTTAGVYCCVAAGKRLSLFRYCADHIFVSFGIIGSILVTLKTDYRWSRLVQLFPILNRIYLELTGLLKETHLWAKHYRTFNKTDHNALKRSVKKYWGKWGWRRGAGVRGRFS